jgi:hypothetical protein
MLSCSLFSLCRVKLTIIQNFRPVERFREFYSLLFPCIYVNGNIHISVQYLYKVFISMFLGVLSASSIANIQSIRQTLKPL